MCTVVFLRRPDHQWPLLFAANRDESLKRPWKAPSRHWPDRPDVTAGIDELAGGTWLGVNDHGVVSGILNRKDSLGNDPRLRSRGELVLEALDHADALDAMDALLDLEPAAYRSFNLFVADNRDAWWLRSTGPDSHKVEAFEIPEGVSMITAWGMNEHDSARTRHYLPKFERAAAPEPEQSDWSEWVALLSSAGSEDGAGPGEAMCITPTRGFGTLSSSLIALEAPDRGKPRVLWRFSESPGDTAAFRDIDLTPEKIA